MFELTLFDHLRLTFGHVAHRHQAHMRTATSRARWSRWLRATEALLMAGVLFTALNVAVGKGVRYAIVCGILATLALVLLLVRLAFDFDASARANGLCAARLWHIRERYQAVLSDLADGAIDVPTARMQRDGLMGDLLALSQDPSSDPVAYLPGESLSAAGDEAALSDEDIDHFLPKSLHKTPTKTAA
jgi:hypothetical protein